MMSYFNSGAENNLGRYSQLQVTGNFVTNVQPDYNPGYGEGQSLAMA